MVITREGIYGKRTYNRKPSEEHRGYKYYSYINDIRVEEQKSEIVAVKKALRNVGKS